MGKQWKQCQTLFLGAPKSLQMVTAAVENGKKKMPEGWRKKLQTIYSLSAEQNQELQAAIIDTNNAVELNLQNATPGNRALAISFAREFDSLDDETSRKIFEILKRRKED